MANCVVKSFAIFPALLLLSEARVPATRSSLPSFLMILGDDIGWADFKWNNGTANTPRMAEWAKRAGSILMQDSHSGGTVCSPTRASVLTGRTPLRDCINGVYGCSDMTECVPSFVFAPQRTFTIGDAARAASPEYVSQHWAKWHLGSLYNDSESLGGITSSPVTHGFDRFNSTVEVAPTGTTNCQCNADWQKNCLYGHYGKMTHCGGGPGPDPNASRGCCFNYWWPDENSPHGVNNLSNPIPLDETDYISDSFTRFLDGLNGRPFVAQLAFHNCHIPFVGTPTQRELCQNGTTCTESPSSGPLSNLSDAQLDFYACLNELDGAVGRVLDALDEYGYGHNTLTWLATDNGPEVNCPPEGICTQDHYRNGPGAAGPLRGRKRDVWEGGHRIPSIISWPAVVQGDTGRVMWEQVVTHDFLATIMDVLNVTRPANQADWGVDGRSILPLLKSSPAEPQTQRVYEEGKNIMPIHPMGWMYDGWDATTANIGFRYGHWKFVRGSKSCSNDDCKGPQLFNLADDLGERMDVSKENPEIFQAIQQNFTIWYNSVLRSIVNESQCPNLGPKPPPGPPPPPAPPSSECKWIPNMRLSGNTLLASLNVTSVEGCCGACVANSNCHAAVFYASKNQCNLRSVFKTDTGNGTVCIPNSRQDIDNGMDDIKKDWIVDES